MLFPGKILLEDKSRNWHGSCVSICRVLDSFLMVVLEGVEKIKIQDIKWEEKMSNRLGKELKNCWKNAAKIFGLVWFVFSASAFGEDAVDPGENIEEVVVTAKRDYFSILPNQSSDSSFGLDMSLVDTPRSVSEVREDLIQKFALRSVDDLVRLTPGAFTSSFFGIRGAMDIRGEPADNYFRGFRRIANPGAFNTIVRGAEKLEILRGQFRLFMERVL